MLPDNSQLDLYSIVRIVDDDDSLSEQVGDCLGVTAMRSHLDAAQELRQILKQPDCFEGDLIFGFPSQAVALEYFSRLHEMAYQNWLLMNASRLDFLGIYGAEEVLPRVLELFACNLVMFTYDCWVEVTPMSADGGIDGFVYKSWKKDALLGLQTKLYAGSVPVSDIREFYGALMMSKVPLASGLFITSSRLFPKINKAKGIRLFLVDGNGLDSIMNLVEIVSQWLMVYSGCCNDIPLDNPDFQEVAARLYVIRTKIDAIMRVGDVLPLRRENGLNQDIVNKWLGRGLDQFL